MAAAQLEFGAATGLLADDEIKAALAAAETDDARPIHALLGTLSERLSARLDARWHAHGLTDPETPGAIWIGFLRMEERGDNFEYAVAAVATEGFYGSVPLQALPARVATRIHRAIRLMDEAWNVAADLLWHPEGVSPWWSEQMTAFEELEPAVRADPQQFHAFCVVDKLSGLGVFERGADDVESAQCLAAELEHALVFTDWMTGVLAATATLSEPPSQPSAHDTARRAQALRDEVIRLRYEDASDGEHPWLTWIETVARAVLATSTVPAKPDIDLIENYYPVEVGIQIDPGAPWFDEELERAADAAAETSEGFVSVWSLADAGRRGPSILAALESLVDAAAMVALLPNESNEPARCGANGESDGQCESDR
jgi:hypothetical protein